MEYQSKLKKNVWVDVSTLADWLDIKDTKVNVSSNKASKTIQDITFTAQNGGLEGNSISIAYVGGGTAGSEAVNVNNSAIEVTIEDGVSTAQQIADAINNKPEAVNLISLVVDANNAQIAQVATSLEGGTDPIAERAKLVKRLEILINAACDRIETYLQGVVLPKQFTEHKDGNSSNVIIPSQWPVMTVDEIIIDYLRGFPTNLVLDETYYFNRGPVDKRQETTDTTLRISGTDIVLRDDGRDYIVGRFFAGSSLGSIQLKYTAGWTRTYTRAVNDETGLLEIDPDDVPYDMVLAVLQLVEFWYYQRDNRDIGIIGKGVMGENYTKRESGIPTQITDILDPYRDEAFGSYEQPQRNIMGIDY